MGETKRTGWGWGWAERARELRLARATHLRKLAKGSRKKLTRSEELVIMDASQRK